MPNIYSLSLNIKKDYFIAINSYMVVAYFIKIFKANINNNTKKVNSQSNLLKYTFDIRPNKV